MMLLAAVLTLTLSAPEGWQAKEPRITVEITEEQLAMAGESVIPQRLVMVAKYAEPHDGFNPTFQVMLTRAQELSATEILRALATSLAGGSPDFKIEEEIRATKIAGRDAAELTSTSTATRGDRRIAIRTRFIAVPHEKCVLLIGMTAPAAENVREESDAILRSMELK